MQLRTNKLALLLVLALSATRPAWACGFGEAPGGCGESPESEAKYILHWVVAAVESDKAKATGEFTRGENGFRTVDTYVFCVGANGVMTAHPNPILQGQDVHDLHDETGNYFIATMLKNAKPGQTSEIRYLFPRPGGTTAISKTTYYTRASDQVCGVGVYDGDEPSGPATTPEARVAKLRQKLSSEIPANANADWTAFLEALDEQNSAQSAAFAKAREQIQAAVAVLASAAHPTPDC